MVARLDSDHWNNTCDSYLPNALMLLDDEARVLFANPLAIELFDVVDIASTHTIFSEWLSPESKAEFHEELGKLAGNETSEFSLKVECELDSHDIPTIRLCCIKLLPAKDSSSPIFLLLAQKLNQSTHLDNLNMIFNHFYDAIFLTPLTPEGTHENFIEVNETACQRLGYSKEELLTFNARTINPQANVSLTRRSAAALKKEKRALFEAIHVAKDGSKIPVAVDATLFNENGKDYILSVVKDLRGHKQLESKESLLGRLMEYSWNEIYVFNSASTQVIMANLGAMENLGLSKKELLTCKFTDLITERSQNRFREFANGVLQGKNSKLMFETELKRKNLSTYPVEIRLQLSTSEVPPVFLAHVQDITERKQTEKRLKYLATFDALTNLPNRSLFVDRLQMAMENSKRMENLIAISFLDLDGFKRVNDTYGHEAGDQLIQEVGKRLSACVRKSDTVARLGGDEFTLILTNIQQIDGVHVVVNKILNHIREPFYIKGKEIQTSTSIGVTIYPFNDEDGCYELIRQADSAMYHAKNAGKNICRFYSYELSSQEVEQAKMDAALSVALTNNEFELYYQPKINLKSKKIIAVEALLRWHNTEFGNVSPAQFVPLLENKGLITDVGNWVINESCRQQRVLIDAGYNIDIAINVSARQMEDESFLNKLSASLEQYDINGSSLEIEITEGLLIDNNENVINILQAIKEMGISISLDDFGTGYSSLGYLKRFPIDIVKIDRSFVMDLDDNQDSLIIVNAIIGLAKNLSLKVTAEGIESKWHADFLEGRGCDEGQGFYFARPMPAKDLLRLLSADQKK